MLRLNVAFLIIENDLKLISLIRLKEIFLKPEDIVIMHPYRHTPMQEKRKQSGTNERKHETIKMLIVLYDSNMWRGESGGLFLESLLQHGRVLHLLCERSRSAALRLCERKQKEQHVLGAFSEPFSFWLASYAAE